MTALLWTLAVLAAYRITAAGVRMFTGAPRRPLLLSQIGLGAWAAYLLIGV